MLSFIFFLLVLAVVIFFVLLFVPANAIIGLQNKIRKTTKQVVNKIEDN